MTRRALVLSILAVSLGGCRACDAPQPSHDRDSEASRRTGATPIHVERALAQARVPGIAYAAVTREREIVASALGEADVVREIPATARTPFEAASIAKTIIATCVMQLVASGDLALDADVSRYVGFAVRHPASATPITLRMLLSHTSSIHDRLPETAARGDVLLGDFLRGYLAADGGPPERRSFLDAGPGLAAEYSNVGASLAALAVERAAGATFRDVARRRVFEPLGMRSTWLGDAAGAPPGAPAPARPHVARGGELAVVPAPSHALYPVVDLFSTPGDLGRFARAILRGGELDGARVLPAASVGEMLRAQAPDVDDGQALGWQIRTFGGARVVGHEGEDAGASTALYLDVDAGIGAVMLANGDAFASDDPARAAALGALIEELLAAARAPE